MLAHLSSLLMILGEEGLEFSLEGKSLLGNPQCLTSSPWVWLSLAMEQA